MVSVIFEISKILGRVSCSPARSVFYEDPKTSASATDIISYHIYIYSFIHLLICFFIERQHQRNSDASSMFKLISDLDCSQWCRLLSWIECRRGSGMRVLISPDIGGRSGLISSPTDSKLYTKTLKARPLDIS